jgi:hypothetical protein
LCEVLVCKSSQFPRQKIVEQAGGLSLIAGLIPF